MMGASGAAAAQVRPAPAGSNGDSNGFNKPVNSYGNQGRDPPPHMRSPSPARAPAPAPASRYQEPEPEPVPAAGEDTEFGGW
jgi:hypothetical protein